MQHPDGSTTFSQRYQDVNGCGSGYEDYTGTITRTKKIASVVVALYYEDEGVEIQSIDNAVLDNPNVG
jgi:hypothetical protein